MPTNLQDLKSQTFKYCNIYSPRYEDTINEIIMRENIIELETYMKKERC